MREFTSVAVTRVCADHFEYRMDLPSYVKSTSLLVRLLTTTRLQPHEPCPLVEIAIRPHGKRYTSATPVDAIPTDTFASAPGGPLAQA
jgi:hypothetical protein